jgi:hypothetical protein
MGGFILYDSAMVLVRFEHPAIGLIELFGQQVWLGWLMIGALLYSGLPRCCSGGPSSDWPPSCTTRCSTPTPR